jgi:peptidoglycan/xylan/chitin deacetylase (PgdA/CDA1 family)
VEERVFTQVATEEKVVALTFDDGPHPRNTPAILDLLAEYDAKATFFVIGKNMELYGEAAKRAALEGHELGNHTYGHPALAKLTSRGLLEEILKNEELISRVSGQQTTLFRPPEGYCTGEVRRVATENGFSVILWSIDTRDWAGVATDRIVDTVMKNTVPGSIILFHDYSGKNCHTVSALKEILPRLDAAGFRFVTVSELLTFAKTPVVNPGD